MSNTNFLFNEFPNDEIKRVVWLRGGVYSRGINSTTPLVDVLLVRLDSNDQISGHGCVKQINVSELDTARLGTIWIGQNKTSQLYDFKSQSTKRFNFTLPNDFKSDRNTISLRGKMVVSDKYPTIPPYVYPIHDHLPKDKKKSSSFTNARLTVLNSDCGVAVIIPALELFTGTYAFGNKQIRNDLCNISLQDINNKYIKNKGFVSGDTFEIELIEPKSENNTIFLAHLAMNIEAKKRMCCIYSAIQSKKTNFDVYPYHVNNLLLDCDGVWLNNEKTRFLVLRINGSSLPNEYIVCSIGKHFDIEKKTGELPAESKYFNQQNALHETLPVTANNDPRKGSGACYHLSEVKAIGEEVNFITKLERKEKTVDDAKCTPLSNEEINQISSGDPHYGKGSKNVGQMKSSEKEPVEKILESKFLSNINDALTNGKLGRANPFYDIEYYDHEGGVSHSVQYGEIAGRKFLLVKVLNVFGRATKKRRTAFILEFDRTSEKDGCQGLVFNTETGNLSNDLVAEILRIISANEFKYRRKNSKNKMDHLALPVSNKAIFKHALSHEKFNENYLSHLISKLKNCWLVG